MKLSETNIQERSSRVCLSDSEQKRFGRQLLLPELGETGQLRLRNARVLVIGAGGLGSPVLEYLSAAGIGVIGVVDFDHVDESNLHRQVIHGLQSLGESKVVSAASRVAALAGDMVRVEEFPFELNASNAEDLIAGFDLVVDGSDNFSTRYLVSDICREQAIPLVWGSLLGFGGQVSLFWSEPPSGVGITLRDVFPSPPPDGSVPSCGTAGVIGALCGQVGSLMAMEVVKVIARMGQTLLGRLVTIDALDARYREIPLRVPAGQPQLSFDAQNPATVSPLALRESGDAFRVIDVRESEEFAAGHVPGAVNIPRKAMAEHDWSGMDGEDSKPIVLYCHSGVRARNVWEELPAHMKAKVSVLEGSYLGWTAALGATADKDQTGE